ncbi:tetratricopeptide repeat protein [Achromobacter seleniivolatilans]|uniref:Tetratricopeptide repeat protein n=1 Tax=Achromobacter seleniivolatilans TaxID=3047478 RepID=A0ABY9MB06_9BURK|nr:tetratricopeptide repeat protein [Achromobacter sp. R39]WMD22982.1 tetratricopeptide repeat protein [Achromobacter sp. R39]
MNKILIAAVFIPCVGLAGCAVKTPPAASEPRIDELPMYGGMDRSAAAELSASDKKLIADATNAFGSSDKASQAWVGQGYRFYQADQLGMAMRRFNQAWLMNPDNPEVYTGFAAVLHDQGKYCQAMSMMDQAMSHNPPKFQGIYADAGRIAARCAAEDKTLPPEARVAATARSDEWYRKGEAVEPDKGYLYASWATAYYWRGQYDQAWAMVVKARAAGGQLSPRFMDMLRAKMPDPQS